LTRSLDFKTRFRATLVGTGIAGVIGVAAAYLDAGAWSLAIQAVANEVLSPLALWVLSDRRPAPVLNLECLKEMLGFGSRRLPASLIATSFDNLHQMFIHTVLVAYRWGNRCSQSWASWVGGRVGG
jgi:O-antigen/teichoic acid export membrane protein